VVLATLVLAITASVSVAEVAATSRARRVVAERLAIAEALRRSAEAPIQSWLGDSGSIVLPPDSAAPMVRVLDDRWTAGDVELALGITAWDQCGLVPLATAGTASPLRLVLPEAARRALDGVDGSSEGPPGLDLLGGAGMRVYPAPDEPGPVPGLGALIGTHGRGRLNVSTAPASLVEHAMRQAGRGGGITAVLEARSAGKLPVLGDPPAGSAAGDDAPAIAATSDAWAFRIDVEVGASGRGDGAAGLRASWWAVYRADGSSWECVQRLAILE
jgi:hypothetical protein